MNPCIPMGDHWGHESPFPRDSPDPPRRRLGQQLSVVSTNPERGMATAEPGSSISVTFDRATDPDTIELSSFHAFSRGAGPLPESFLVS